MKVKNEYKKKTVATYKSHNFGGVVVTLPDGKKKIQINDTWNYQDYVQKTCNNGDKITLYITNKRPTRTQQQHKFYFAYLGIIARETGNDKDELHEWAKKEFLTTGITEIFGTKIRKVKSTTDLNKAEFSEYLERISARTEIPIPQVDEDYEFIKLVNANE